MRSSLRDTAGRALATYVPAVHDGRLVADRLARSPGASLDDVAAALMQRHPGWRAATEEEALARALVARGARARRHALALELDLSAVPPRVAGVPPTGVAITPFAGVPEELGAVSLAAYPVGHPDHTGGTVAQEAGLLRDYVLGRGGWRPSPASRVALRDGAAVGAAVVNELAVPHRPEPIAWLTELFRAPDAALAGLGAVLLDTAVLAARATGVAAVGLSVTAGNPAGLLYADREFRPVAETWSVVLPGHLEERATGRREAP